MFNVTLDSRFKAAQQYLDESTHLDVAQNNFFFGFVLFFFRPLGGFRVDFKHSLTWKFYFQGHRLLSHRHSLYLPFRSGFFTDNSRKTFVI